MDISSTNKDYTVLIAVDGSEQALHAFNFYMSHLHQADHEVVLIHCSEPLTIIGEIPNADVYDNMLEETKARARMLEEKYSKMLTEKKIRGRFVAAFGHRPGESIVAQAQDAKASMIVTGTRGLGTTRRTLMGSVSDYVVHHAHCPVLVCRK